jgi:small subunit ribosomal protein S13
MENKITKDLSEDELITLRDEVSKYMIEGDLVNLFFFHVPDL